MSFNYPKVRRDESVSDNFNGTEVKDPYRWLEDPESDETKKFVELQNEVTVPYIESYPKRDALKSRLTKMFDFPKYGCPCKKGPRYFYSMNTGLQNQSVMYVQESFESEAKVFLDPNTFSEDGTIAIKTKAWSESGRYFAYGLSESGSDWFKIEFIDIDTGKELPDVIEKVKFSSIEWTHDEKGVFYCRYPDAKVNTDGTETLVNENKMIYYHKMGTPQSEDVLCISFPEHPKWNQYCEVSDCGQYLITSVHEGCSKTVCLYVSDLQSLPDGIQGKLPLTPIFENQEEDYDFYYVTNEENIFTFKTNFDASNWKLINIDINNPAKEMWSDLIQEDLNDVMEWACCVNNNVLVICYLHHVKHMLQLNDLKTGQVIRKLPLDIGSVTGFSGHKKHSEIFYYFTSFTTPGIIYRCDLNTESPSPTVFREISVPNFDGSIYETTQVFYTSQDGTKVPMFLIHSKGMKLDGGNPCLLYGYGGFDISITPGFSVNRLLFVSGLKGVYAVANIRGGGEYGKKWHDGGRHLNKKNVFNDFIAAAEYLIQNKYTSSPKLTIQGGSNGGLLVAACANQRPDLFGCIIAQVGVMDMLRFHKFTIGHAWCTEYGCADESKFFEYMHSYSPLHNIRVPDDDNVQYPCTLLLTADHDDRVVPLHSLKYMAQMHHVLSSVPKQTNPLMIRIDTKAGHGGGKPTAKVIEEYTDIYSFIIKSLGLCYAD